MTYFHNLALSVARQAPPPPAPLAMRYAPTVGQRQERYFSMSPKKSHILNKSGTLPVRASPPYIQTLSEWTVDSVLAALNEHALGEFARSGLLWQWMQRDDRLQTVMRVRRAALTTLPFTLQPASQEDPSPQEQEVARVLQEEWSKCVPEHVIRAMVDRAVGAGVAIVRVAWRPGKYGFWWPKLTVWPAADVRWDDVKRCYLARTKAGAEVRVKPGMEGQCGWLVWEPDGPRGFQWSAVMALALPVLITSFNWRDWVNYNEAHGRPIRKAIVPAGATTSQKQTFLANLKALGRTTSSILCQRYNDDSGFDFEFVTPDGDVTATFEKSIDRADKAKATVILGQTLVTDVSAAVGMSPTDVRQNAKSQVILGDAESLSTCLHDQLIEPWACMNYGSAALAPWPHWEVEAPVDTASQVEKGVKAVEAAEKIDLFLSPTNLRVNRTALAENLGMELESRPADNAPPAENKINLFQSEGLLAKLAEMLALYTNQELDIPAIMADYGIKIKPRTTPAPAVETGPATASPVETPSPEPAPSEV